MKNNHLWIWFVLALIFACLALTACSQQSATAADGPAGEEESKPIQIEHVGNAVEPTHEKLTEEAAKRLDLQTKLVTGQQRTVIPYSAILYDNQGYTWIYINTEPLTFVRHRVTVDSIQGDQAILSSSLPAGAQVVTVGAEELYGSEFEFEEE
jgi:ABC-type oligopeptide transport system substrate-binding subunit